MKRILFFETTEFTGATRVTRTIAKKVSRLFDTRFVIISDLQNAKMEINKAIDKEQPDILFCSFTSLSPDVIEEGKEKKLTLIVRNDYNLSDLSFGTKKRIFQTYPQADWIIVQTTEMKQDVLSHDSLKDCRVKVIENPLDEEDILKKSIEPNPFEDNGCFHFLWIGRRVPIKDLPTLQKAFEMVHKQYPKTDLTLVSDNPNPYKWMKNADCMVISSISEASPNVLREALFLGTKVVSTDCSPSVREFLQAERIARVGNVEELAKKMISAIIG